MEIWQFMVQQWPNHSGLSMAMGTREITRLDIMTYVDPASNPGSKP